MKPDSVHTHGPTRGSPAKALRVLSVVPGKFGGPSFIFAKRQIVSLQKARVICKTVFLPPRTTLLGHPVVYVAKTVISTAKKWQKFRGEIRTFQPQAEIRRAVGFRFMGG